MTDRGEWLKRYSDFQGKVQQLVATDVYEHGRPLEEREHSFRDLKQRAIEMGGLAFELFVEACALEEASVSRLIRADGALSATTLTYTDAVDWADRDPNEEN